MKFFTINIEDKIAVFARREHIPDTTCPIFASEAELTEITNQWPMARLIEICPANLFVTTRGEAKVLDFGLGDRSRCVA